MKKYPDPVKNGPAPQHCGSDSSNSGSGSSKKIHIRREDKTKKINKSFKKFIFKSKIFGLRSRVALSQYIYLQFIINIINFFMQIKKCGGSGSDPVKKYPDKTGSRSTENTVKRSVHTCSSS